jgi:HAD superfamily hydrolase (TIGR01549 family)
MIKAVIFDLDQTLIDSKDAHLASMVNSLEREGWPTKIKWLYGMTAEGILKYNFTDMPEETVRKIVAHKRIILKNYLNKVKVLSGAVELLRFLKENKIKVVLITNNTHREIYELLDTLDIRKYFDILVGIEDTDEPKPSPHPIIKAIEQLRMPLEEILYIGDSDTDIEAAKAAGLRIIINTQVNDTAEEKDKADWVVTDLKHALRVIKEQMEEK